MGFRNMLQEKLEKYICEFQGHKTTEEKCCSKSDKNEEMLLFHGKKSLLNKW
jgi:hypothetical protein